MSVSAPNTLPLTPAFIVCFVYMSSARFAHGMQFRVVFRLHSFMYYDPRPHDQYFNILEPPVDTHVAQEM
jgi:hypothetical protein